MMNKQLTQAELEFIISRVLKNAEETSEESKKDNSEFMEGKKLAYYEVLDTIKNELIVRDVDLKPFGLNSILENLI